MTDFTYPGVYVLEDPSLTLSVGHSETAVPVIFYDKAEGDSFIADTSNRVVPVDSWLSFTKLYQSAKKPDYEKSLAPAVHSYFDNGGGRCYLAPADSTQSNIVQQLTSLTDVTLLVQAGCALKDFSGMIGQTELSKVFALYDAVETAGTEAPTLEQLTKGCDRSDQGAVYYPHLVTTQYVPPTNGTPTATKVPASAAVAGAYCKVDSLRGVWKAPANVTLSGGLSPSIDISDAVQGELNKGKAVNVIRKFRNGDTLIWGARTLDAGEDWRYVPVRRLFNSIEVDIKLAMQPALFEPNMPATWERVRSAIDNYLHSLWQQGALFGTKPEEAYFVKIGLNVTMSSQDIEQGKMIVKVGVAAVRPAEFIVLEFSQFVANS